MNHDRLTKERRQPSSLWASGTGTLLVSAIGVLLLASACAKQPQVATPTSEGLWPKTEPLSAVVSPQVSAPGGTASVAQPFHPEGQAPVSETAPSAAAVPGTAEASGSSAPGLWPKTEPLSAVVSPQVSAPGGEVVMPAPVPLREQPVATVAQAEPKRAVLEDIYFDFDKADLRPDAQARLVEDVAWLQDHPTAAIKIEGHCDERGTSEYNLALGDRRAKAAKDYLVASGIDPTHLTIISYGKERPFVFGHDETAWRWNRRDHLVVANK